MSVKPNDILHVKPSEKTQEWMEKVDQIAGLNFRCPNCRVPLCVGVFELLFADKGTEVKP